MDEMREEESGLPPLVFRRSRLLLPRWFWMIIFIFIGIPLALLTLGTVFMLFSDPEPWPMLAVLLILDFLVGAPLRAFVVGKVVMTSRQITVRKAWDVRTVNLKDVTVVAILDDAPAPLLALQSAKGESLLEFDTYDYANPEELMQALREAVPEWRGPPASRGEEPGS